MSLAKSHDAKSEPSCLVSSRVGSQTHDLLPLFPQSSTSSCGFGNSDLVHESIAAADLTGPVVPTDTTGKLPSPVVVSFRRDKLMDVVVSYSGAELTSIVATSRIHMTTEVADIVFISVAFL